MKSIIIKEFKFLWLFVVAILALMLVFALLSSILLPPFYHSHSNWAADRVQLVLIAAPYLTFVIALMQWRAESESGGESFIIQRQISLVEIFLSKFIANFVLTFAVTMLLYVLMELVRAQSDTVDRQFHWHLQLFALNFARCVIVWLAAVASYGSVSKRPYTEMLPAAALPFAFLTQGWGLLLAPLYLAAASGIYASFGAHKRMSWISKVALGTLNALGSIVVIGFLVQFLFAMSLLFGTPSVTTYNLPFGTVMGPTIPGLSRSTEIPLLMGVIGISMFAMYRLSRRLEWPARTFAGWLLACTALGPVAVLTAASLSDFDKQLPCPDCKRLRLVSKDRCWNCGKLWPHPPTDGAEIFDEGAYAARSVDAGQVKGRLSPTANRSSLAAHGFITPGRALFFKELGLLKPFIKFMFMFGLFLGTLTLRTAMLDWEPTPDFNLCSWFILFGVLCAEALALIQNAQELTSTAGRDFAVQRPVSPSKQFWIASGAGGLVFLAVVGSCTGIYLLVATAPGTVPGPFSWKLALLCLRDVAIAPLFWQGAILTYTMSVRLNLWRLVPFLFCFGVMIAAHDAATIPEFLAVAIPAYTVIILSAWSSSVSRGEPARMPVIGKCAVAVVSVIGLFFGLFVFNNSYTVSNHGKRWTGISMSSFWRNPNAEFGAINGSEFYGYSWCADFNHRTLLCYDNHSNRMIGLVDGSGWHATDINTRTVHPLDLSQPTFDLSQGRYCVIASEGKLVKVDLQSPDLTRVVSSVDSGSRDPWPAISSGASDSDEYNPRAAIRRIVPMSFCLDGLLLITQNADPVQVFWEALLPTIIGLAITLFLSRRLGFSRRATVVWSFAVLLLGLYVPAIMSVLSSWPLRLRCPNCGRKRLVTANLCWRCGATWPKPPSTGLEVFEPAGELIASKALAEK